MFRFQEVSVSVSKRKRIKSVPNWIEEGQRAVLIYDIFAAPYEIDCDCRTCQLIRENESFLASLFRPPARPR